MECKTNRNARHRSLNPERYRCPLLRQCIALFQQMDGERLALARNLASHEMGARAEFEDDPDKVLVGKKLECVLAMDDADLACRRATGRGMLGVKDYKEYASAGAPALSTVYKWLGPWDRAMATAGLLNLRQPEAELTLEPGSRAKARDFSPEECIAAVALVFERFRGRRMSGGAYEETRYAVGGDSLPTWHKVMQVLVGGKGQGHWDRVRSLAVEHILASPDAYPAAFAYLSAAREVRG